MSEIEYIHGRQIIDSRGNPTVEVEITLDSGAVGRAAVPSGASTGVNEALELRDGDKTRFLGKGVSKAVDNINGLIAEELEGANAFDQAGIDAELLKLDGTENKGKLGANAMLGVSMAVARAASEELGLPLYRYLGGVNAKVLPVPMMNILNGGAHSDAPVDIQEFMVMPTGASTFSEAIRMGSEIFHSLKSVLKKAGLNTAVGDEGGFAPGLKSNEHAVEVILEAIGKAGLTAGKDVFLALDAAASEFWNEEKKAYVFHKSDKSVRSSAEMADFWASWCAKYPIISIEDGFDQLDWTGWKMLTDKVGDTVQLVGDDLFVTNTKFLKRGIQERTANAILVKVNQIGTLTETLDAIEMAKRNRYASIISHRSGETEDTTIADIAVATNAGQIKTGSMSRTDRVAKYNQLLRIEESLGSEAVYGAKGFLDRI